MNTRFNPTINGPIHLGHIYMCLVNIHYARKNGGNFILRLDDNQFWWSTVIRDEARVRVLGEQLIKDIEWLGIRIDKISFQSTREHEVRKYLDIFCNGKFPVRPLITPSFNGSEFKYTTCTPYPYAPWYTAQKVILDFLDAVNPLIRGEDLVTEYCLYEYFGDIWNLPRPRHIYLPRLRVRTKSGIQEISKSIGNFTVSKFGMDGIQPSDVIKYLAESCLIDPGGDWDIENIKPEPTLIL